jgi:hypothetical protein
MLLCHPALTSFILDSNISLNTFIFLWCKSPGFIQIQNNSKLIVLHILIFRIYTGNGEIVNWMAEGILWIWSAPKFVMIVILTEQHTEI